MKKILITGANGFFGSRFNLFYKDKYDILSLTHKDLDITDESKTLHLIKDFNPDYVIHAAAIADTGLCQNNPDWSYDINVHGTINVAKGCAITKSKLIYLSSEQVYNGNIESGPYTEETIPNPNTVYGKQKLEAEEKLKYILDELWILRLTWLFSFPERNCKVNSNIVWNIVSSVLKGTKSKEPINEYRGMTYVYELIENFNKLLDAPYGIYNTGSENDLNRYDVACIVLKELGLEHKISDILEKDTERFKDFPRDLRISNEKLKNVGIHFSETKDAVRKCIKDFRYNI